MKADYVHKDSRTLEEKSQVFTRWIDPTIEELKRENHELKKQLEVGEEQYKDLAEEKESLQEQLSSITLELEEYKNQVSKGLYNTCLPYSTGYDRAIKEKENQQKEFIEYLENEIKNIEEAEKQLYKDRIPKYFEHGIVKGERYATEEILAKYKEIIGGKDDNE